MRKPEQTILEESMSAYKKALDAFCNDPKADVEAMGEGIFVLGEVQRVVEGDKGLSMHEAFLARQAFVHTWNGTYEPRGSEAAVDQHPFVQFLNQQLGYAQLREMSDPAVRLKAGKLLEEQIIATSLNTPKQVLGVIERMGEEVVQNDLFTGRLATQATEESEDFPSITLPKITRKRALAVISVGLAAWFGKPVLDTIDTFYDPVGHAERAKADMEKYERENSLGNKISAVNSRGYSVTYPTLEPGYRFESLEDVGGAKILKGDSKTLSGTDIEIVAYRDSRGKVIPQLVVASKRYLLNGDIAEPDESSGKLRPDLVELRNTKSVDAKQSIIRTSYVSIIPIGEMEDLKKVSFGLTYYQKVREEDSKNAK